MLNKIGDLIKDTVELNLKYSATLVRLSTEYLKDVNQIIGKSPRAQEPGGEPATRPKPTLLIAGQLHETPGAAFTLTNSADKPVTANLLVQGELTERQVTVSPASRALEAGETAVIRIRVTIDDTLETNRDYVGSVIAPGLSTQSVDFVVRRLEGEFEPASHPQDSARPRQKK